MNKHIKIRLLIYFIIILFQHIYLSCHLFLIFAASISLFPAGSPPGDVQGLLDFGLDGAQQVCAHLLQQLSEQDKQPVLQVLPVYCDEVHQSFQEHAEHLRTYARFKHFSHDTALFDLNKIKLLTFRWMWVNVCSNTDKKHTYSLLLNPQHGRPCNKRHSISFKGVTAPSFVAVF